MPEVINDFFFFKRSSQSNNSIRRFVKMCKNLWYSLTQYCHGSSKRSLIDLFSSYNDKRQIGDRSQHEVRGGLLEVD